MTTTNIRLPKNLERLDDDGGVISNFDHEIDIVIAEDLKVKEAWASYPGWNFWGKVWWDREANTYHCEILVYGSYCETFSGSLEEIMRDVSSKYGAS